MGNPEKDSESLSHVDDDHVPDAHYLKFPPFPSLTDGPYASVNITPLEQYETQGIQAPSLPAGDYNDNDVLRGLNGYTASVAEHGRDAHGREFVALDLPSMGPDGAAPKIGAGRVFLSDSWKLGSDPAFPEPGLKFLLDNHIARPPFARMVDAALAFYDSRYEAFSVPETKSLWTLCRAAFGLSRDFSLIHWPGSGPDGILYEPTRTAHRRAHTESVQLFKEGAVGEECCLLRETDKSVRGFLAMARRETDGMWGIERTLVLTDIMSTFLAYINIHGVFTDDYLAPRFARAERLARSAGLATKQAKAVEDVITKVDGINQTSWVMFGGTYLERQNQKPASVEEEKPKVDEEDDGGWSVPTKTSPVIPTLEEANIALRSLYAPLAPNAVCLLNVIPFSRRRVTAVFAPNPSATGPVFMKTHYRLRTAPAPWTDEEQWRDGGFHKGHPASGDDAADAAQSAVFEKEAATIEDPEELDIWVSAADLDLDPKYLADPSWMVGLGFCARWAEVGNDDHRWWVLKLKDFVLPAFWQSTAAERAEMAKDPAAPHPGNASLPAEPATVAAPAATAPAA